MSTQDDSLMPGRRQNWACSLYCVRSHQAERSGRRRTESRDKADKEWSAGSG